MHRASGFKDQENRRDIRRTTVFDHGPGAFGVRLALPTADVDRIVRGKNNLSRSITPETRTQAQVSAM